MKIKLLSLLLSLSLILSLAACGTTGSSVEASSTVAAQSAPEAVVQPEEIPEPDSVQTEAPETGAETYIFTDDAGRQVEVPTNVSRIVPSAPLAQIFLLAIAPEMFVGIASDFDEPARGIIPDEMFDLPYFGSLYAGADLNVEELALTDPDLIIDIGEAKDSTVEDLDALQEQTLIPSVFISADMESMPETFRKLGKLLGKEEKGEELAQFLEKIYAQTLDVMDKVGDNKVNALYVLGEEGLNVIAAGSYHSEVIDMLTNNLAVVDNPLSKGSGNEVTMEQISLWNPDFVIFAPGSIYSTVQDIPAWNQVSAIVSGSYVEVPDSPHNWMSMPPAVQRYLGLIWLTAVLYPEYCDYDVKAEIMEYYQLFYNCQLTEEQYTTITTNAFLED